MSSEDKQKLDDIPERPTTIDGTSDMTPANLIEVDTPEQHYALAVDRTSGTGPEEYVESWVNISHLVQPGSGGNLIWEERDSNNIELRQYRQGSTVRNIRATGFVDTSGNEVGATNPNAAYLSIQLATFTPTFTGQSIGLSWDQPFTTMDANVDNPTGVDQYISSVRDIQESSATILSTFTAGTQTPTAAAGVDWIQPFTSTTFLANGTTNVGEVRDLTLLFNQHDGRTETPFTTSSQRNIITWGSVNAGAPRATLSSTSINFYERVTGITINASITGLSRPTNGRIDWIANNGLSGGRTTPGVSGTSLTETYTLVNPLYKDRTQILSTDNATVTATIIVTRPADVVSTSYNVTLQNNADSNIPAAIGVTMPRFQLTGTDLMADTITPYNSSTNNLAVLTGDFDTGNGLTRQSGTSIRGTGSSEIITLNFVGPNPSVYWVGVPGDTAPTIELESAPNSNVFNAPDSASTRTQTVNFNTTGLTGSNVPAGWTNVEYTFRGVQVTATQRARITY